MQGGQSDIGLPHEHLIQVNRERLWRSTISPRLKDVMVNGMRTLVLYFSNTGHTQHVAEVLAQQLHAELGEITCARYLKWYGPVAMAWDIFTRNLPAIDVVIPPDAAYDLIVVGGPVWAARAAPPVLRFLRSRPTAAPAFGLFVTCRGTSSNSPPEPAVAQMKLAVKAPVIATAIFREAEIHHDTFADSATAFVERLTAAKATGTT